MTVRPTDPCRTCGVLKRDHVQRGTPENRGVMCAAFEPEPGASGVFVINRSGPIIEVLDDATPPNVIAEFHMRLGLDAQISRAKALIRALGGAEPSAARIAAIGGTTTPPGGHLGLALATIARTADEERFPGEEPFDVLRKFLAERGKPVDTGVWDVGIVARTALEMLLERGALKKALFKHAFVFPGGGVPICAECSRNHNLGHADGCSVGTALGSSLPDQLPKFNDDHTLLLRALIHGSARIVSTVDGDQLGIGGLNNLHAVEWETENALPVLTDAVRKALRVALGDEAP